MTDLESGLRQLFEQKAESVRPTSERREMVFRRVRRRKTRNAFVSTLAAAAILAGGFAGAGQLIGEPQDIGVAGPGREGSESKGAVAVAGFPAAGVFDGRSWEFRAPQEDTCIELAFVDEKSESGMGTCELGSDRIRFDERLHRGVHAVMGDVTPEAASLEVVTSSMEGQEWSELPVYEHPETDKRRFFIAFAPKNAEMELTFRSADGEIVERHVIGPYGPGFGPPGSIECPRILWKDPDGHVDDAPAACETDAEGHSTITGEDSMIATVRARVDRATARAQRSLRRESAGAGSQEDCSEMIATSSDGDPNDVSTSCTGTTSKP